ncbi:MAG: tetratricopeptide repeat protein, partial [Bacteroidota bacterium]
MAKLRFKLPKIKLDSKQLVEVGKKIYQTSWRLGVIVILIGVLLFIIKGLRNDRYTIEAFQVPKNIQEAGYNGSVIAQRVMDEVKNLEDFVSSSKEESDEIQWGSQPDLNIEVLGIGVTMNSIMYYIQSMFGKETKKITGELTDLDNEIALTLRQTGFPPETYIEIYEEGGKTKAIIKVIQEAAKSILRKSDPYRMAVYHYKKEDYFQTQEIIQDIIGQTPQEAAWGYLAWGNMLNQQDKPKEAAKKFKQATEIDPKFRSAWTNWGWTLFGIQDYEGALNKFEKAVEIEPKSGHLHNAMGLTLKMMGKYEEADRSYAKAVEVEPDVFYWYNNWSNLKSESLKDTSAAISIINKAKARLQESPDLYFLMATNYVYQNKMDSAYHMIEKVLDIDPDNGVAHLQLGRQ